MELLWKKYNPQYLLILYTAVAFCYIGVVFRLSANWGSETIEECWHQPTELNKSNTKVILFVVDGLRFDMIKPTKNNYSSNSYYNSFTNIHSLLHANQSQTKLFEFFADPPTTTSQRIQGLMKGAVPTYIDFIYNFHNDMSGNGGNGGNDCNDDDFIHILKRSEKKVSFIGDDTWGKYYKSIINDGIYLESFNTYDFYTADNQILNHLNTNIFCESCVNDWDVLIVHWLGVDHLGHSSDRLGFGSSSSSLPVIHSHIMREKLEMLDGVAVRLIRKLNELSQKMSNRGLFLLFGDHGMTDDGQHGGGSREELQSGLFLYHTSNRSSWWPAQSNTIEKMQQVDLAVSLSIAMGLPYVPTMSVGQVMTEFLVHEESNVAMIQLLRALKVNINQHLYLLNKLKLTTRVHLRDILSKIEDVLVKCSVQPNECISLFDHYLLIEEGFQYLKSLNVLLRENSGEFNASTAFVLLMVLLVLTVLLVLPLLSDVEIFSLDSIACLCSIVLSLSYLSNSFIEEERKVIAYLSQTLLACFLIKYWPQLPKLLCWILLILMFIVIHYSVFGFISHNLFIQYLLFACTRVMLGGLLIKDYNDLRISTSVKPIVGGVALCFFVIPLLSTSYTVILLLKILITLWLINISIFYSVSISCCNSLLFAVFPMYSIIQCFLLHNGIEGLEWLDSIVIFCWSIGEFSKFVNSLRIEINNKLYISVLMSFIVGQIGFFATQHKYKFNGVHFQMGFVGLESFNMLFSGIRVAFDTICFEILSVIMSIYLYSLLYNEYSSKIVWQQLVLGRLLQFSLVATAIFVLRNHLMLWEVFMQKFVFSVLFLIVMLIVYICCLVFKI